jgi:hypothetical protein
MANQPAPRRQNTATLVLLRLAIVAVFVAFGASEIAAPFMDQQPGPRGRFATTDGWLGVLMIPEPSRQVQAMLAAVPPDQPILLLAPDGEESSDLTFFVMSYLLWPRQAWWVKCREDLQTSRTEALLPANPYGVISVFFYRMEPPHTTLAVEALGPRLHVARSVEGRHWILYCQA